MKVLALASLVPLAAIGCTTRNPDGSGGSGSWPAQLGETGRLALAGNCVVVAEHASLVCVPRAGDDQARALVKAPDRTYVAIAPSADGEAVLATSTADGQVHLDRVTLDGTVTPVTAVTATAGAGAFAVADQQVVLSTGSQLVLVDADGTVGAPLAQASGIIGSVAARAGLVYYTDDTSLREVDLSGQDMSFPTGSVFVAVAADASAAFIGSHLRDDTGFSFVDNATTGETCEMYDTISRLAVGGGHAFAATDGGIVDAACVAARPPIVGSRDVFDLAIDDQNIYWITRAGVLDRAPRP